MGIITQNYGTLLNHIVLQINQFHWHVVDSQSFPLQIPGFTEVAAKGAYSSSMVYTPQDVQDIVTYAGEVRATYTGCYLSNATLERYRHLNRESHPSRCSLSQRAYMYRKSIRLGTQQSYTSHTQSMLHAS